jgi:hypothetical protein
VGPRRGEDALVPTWSRPALRDGQISGALLVRGLHEALRRACSHSETSIPIRIDDVSRLSLAPKVANQLRSQKRRNGRVGENDKDFSLLVGVQQRQLFI